MSRILLAGIGNVRRGDDAIGPACVHHLLAHVRFPPDVEVADLGPPGLALALHLAAADVVVFVDSLRGPAPGTIAAYDDAALAFVARAPRLDAHGPALTESVFIARLAGGKPHDVRLIGLAGACFDPGAPVTPMVRARVPALSERVLAELAGLHVEWTRRLAGGGSPRWEG